MSTHCLPQEGRRRAVLGVVIAGRYAGHACIDGFGLLRRDVEPFGTWCLRYARSACERAALLEAKLKRAIGRYRPQLVVLATRSQNALDLGLLDAAKRVCRALATPFVVASAHDGLRALGWRPGRSVSGAVRLLCRHFVPELCAALPPRPRVGRSRRLVSHSTWRYRGSAWQATALALLELARIRPWSVVALAHNRPPRCPLLDELERAVLVTEPDSVVFPAV